MGQWPLSYLAQMMALNFKCQDTLITNFTIDSRTVTPGALFFAYKGEKFDGHDFLAQVAAAKGIAAVVDQAYSGPDYGLILFHVSDVVASLQKAAREILKTSPAKVIAITGSIGKTTTKEWLATLLKGAFCIDYNRGSQNTRLTLPLTILNANLQVDWLILEMGMTHPDQIAHLITIAPPHIAAITKISHSHVGNFPSGLGGIAKAKSEIFGSSQTALGLYNADMAFSEIAGQSGECRKKRFSLQDTSADFYLEKRGEEVALFERGHFTLQHRWLLAGPHLLSNYLAAYALARIAGMTPCEIEKQVADLQLPPLRLQRMEKEGVVFINDAYNANPDSMKGALQSLPTPEAANKKVAILGAMKELGDYTKEAHRDVAKSALVAVDMLVCFGKEWEESVRMWQKENRKVQWFEDRASLLQCMENLLQPGDVVLIKGARSLNMDQLIQEWRP